MLYVSRAAEGDHLRESSLSSALMANPASPPDRSAKED
jgi:hypothetical protein